MNAVIKGVPVTQAPHVTLLLQNRTTVQVLSDLSQLLHKGFTDTKNSKVTKKMGRDKGQSQGTQPNRVEVFSGY